MATFLRGSILHFLRDPGAEADPAAWEYWDDGCLRIVDGRVAALGNAHDILKARTPADALHDHSGKLILPGFVDTHVHYAQVDVIASYGRQLLDWLNDYTFPAERAFADPDHARRIASLFLDTLLRHGTTTAAVYPTVHKQSVDAFFEEAQRRGLRMICGKILMDRNSPDYLRDDVEQRGGGLPRPHPALARQGAPRLCADAALRADLEPRAACDDRPAVCGDSGRVDADAPGRECR